MHDKVLQLWQNILNQVNKEANKENRSRKKELDFETKSNYRNI